MPEEEGKRKALLECLLTKYRRAEARGRYLVKEEDRCEKEVEDYDMAF